MPTSYFTQIQITCLFVSILAFLSSLFFFIKGKEKLSIVLLILTSFSVYCFAGLLDPFLNIWDERFHALVAKNLMNHMFKPTLYDDPVVNMAYNYWDKYHIWLHKQPLFLWQIALSFKLFGISEFTLRVPDIILGSILVLITYRSCKLLVNERVGYFAGILTLTSIYNIELISGRQSLEHNDFTFLVYISLSIWSLIEYHFSKNKKWIYLIGIFSGMAILCKWLVGLLVYFGWFIIKILNNKFKISHFKDILTSIIITFLVAAPWQIYTFIMFPVEAKAAFNFNTLHFLRPLEGHDGSYLYHFEQFNSIYGAIASFLVIPSFYLLYSKMKDKKLFFSLLSMVLVVYLFFTLAVTKMQSFTIVISMIIFIALATLFDFALGIFSKCKFKASYIHFIFILFSLSIVLLRFDLQFLIEKHASRVDENSYIGMQVHNKKVFQSLNLPKNVVLFNVKGRQYIEAMFYTGLPAYNFIPSKEQNEDMKKKGRSVAIFAPMDLQLPDYLTDDSTVIVIDEEIKGYD